MISTPYVGPSKKPTTGSPAHVTGYPVPPGKQHVHVKKQANPKSVVTPEPTPVLCASAVSSSSRRVSSTDAIAWMITIAVATHPTSTIAQPPFHFSGFVSPLVSIRYKSVERKANLLFVVLGEPSHFLVSATKNKFIEVVEFRTNKQTKDGRSSRSRFKLF
jgi:hypothetical protein